jgi:hypothetical protein
LTSAVGGTGRTPDGREILVITRTGEGQTLELGYDLATGALTSMGQIDRGTAGAMVSRVWLQGGVPR